MRASTGVCWTRICCGKRLAHLPGKSGEVPEVFGNCDGSLVWALLQLLLYSKQNTVSASGPYKLSFDLCVALLTCAHAPVDHRPPHTPETRQALPPSPQLSFP